MNKTSKKKKLKVSSVLYVTLAVFLTCFFVGAGLGIYYVADVLKDAPALDLARFESTESTRIYDKDGELIVNLGEYIRESVSYDELPQVLIDAFVATEDSRFFEHNGFDLVRFIKAALVNLQTRDFSQGGSTFTMQVVKNTFFSTNTSLAEKSINRKLKEILLSIKAEKVLSKEQIFEYYLNRILFGANNYGIQKGSQYYFGKDVTDLNLSESAMLAGVINAPGSYDPYINLDLATKRRDVVLNLMVHHGYITSEEAQMASSIKIENLLIGKSKASDAFQYQAYVDAVAEECENLTGKNPYDVPMVVYTYMDRDAQAKAENVLDGEGVTYPKNDELLQAALSVIENKTGHIVALGGGRNYDGQRQFNRATSMKRQPGSTAKPLLAYSLAFDSLGWATSHVVEDIPIVYRGSEVLLPNADGKYLGQITLTRALQQSRNTSAMLTFEKLYDKLGRAAIVDHIKNLGFKVDYDTLELGYVIGSSTLEVSPTQLASAYSIFANEGNHTNPTTIKRIEFLDGSAPIEPQYLPVNVISPEAAYLTSVLLQADVESPYFNYMQILKNNNFTVYAKTGTTDYGDEARQYNIPVGAIKDKWCTAMTSEYTVAVWLGYDTAVKGKNTYFDNAKNVLNMPVTIAKNVLFNMHKTNYPAKIARPAGVEEIRHISGTFPYAYSDDADPKVLTTGLIKKEFNTLTTLAPEPVDNLDSFEASILQETNSFIFKFAPYADSNRLLPASNKKIYELSYFKNKGDATPTEIKVEGNVIFDPKLYFGKVEYRADLLVNGELITTFSSAEAVSSAIIPVFNNTGDVQVCGYYGLSLATNIQSNRICHNLNSITPPPDFPFDSSSSDDNDYPDPDPNGDVTFPFE